MPEEVIAVIALAVTVGATAYNAVSSNDAREEQLKLQKEALAKQGIITNKQLELLQQEIDKGALSVFQDKTKESGANPNSTKTTPQNMGVASFDSSTLLNLAGVAFVGYVGWKAIKK